MTLDLPPVHRRVERAACRAPSSTTGSARPEPQPRHISKTWWASGPGWKGGLASMVYLTALRDRLASRWAPWWLSLWMGVSHHRAEDGTQLSFVVGPLHDGPGRLSEIPRRSYIHRYSNQTI